ncbi:MAG: hypothetical protein ACOH5I_03470 [Oligoflexus sp.]
MLLKMLVRANGVSLLRLEGQHLEDFLDRGEIVDGVRYPSNYVKNQGEAWGLYVHGEIVGGYVLIYRGPYRTAEALRINEVNHPYNEDDLIELGGVWVEERFREKKVTTCLWLHMRSRIKFHRKPFLIYGYNIRRTGLQRLYAKMRPHVLCQNPRPPQGVKTHSQASIEVINANYTGMKIVLMALERLGRSAVQSSYGIMRRKINRIPVEHDGQQPKIAESK